MDKGGKERCPGPKLSDDLIKWLQITVCPATLSTKF